MITILTALTSVLIVFVFFGVAIGVLGWLGTIHFWTTSVPPLKTQGGLPGVSLIKPCRGNQDNEEVNFETFFQQDYGGPYEIIFVVNSISDPIVPIIRKFMDKYPDQAAEIVVSTSQLAKISKINALYDGHQKTQYPVIIWSDSDTIVNANYLTQMVASLQHEGTALVTTPQYDTRANNFGSAFKMMGNNADVVTFLMSYYVLYRKKKIAWGHSIGFWKSAFESIPNAWPFLFGFFADDLGLPLIFSRNGKKVVFRNIYCPVECSNKTLKEMIDQKKRWVLCQRFVVGNRYLYLSGMLAYPQIASLILLFITSFSAWSVQLFLGVALFRIFLSATLELLYLKSLNATLRYFWAVFVWDLFQIYFFWTGFRAKTITFRGQTYTLSRDYFLSPVSSKS